MASHSRDAESEFFTEGKPKEKELYKSLEQKNVDKAVIEAVKKMENLGKYLKAAGVYGKGSIPISSYDQFELVLTAVSTECGDGDTTRTPVITLCHHWTTGVVVHGLRISQPVPAPVAATHALPWVYPHLCYTLAEARAPMGMGNNHAKTAALRVVAE